MATSGFTHLLPSPSQLVSTPPTPTQPLVQHQRQALPDSIVKRIADFLLTDRDVVRLKLDGSKHWEQPLLHLSMVNRATRLYIWKYRVDRLNLARCLKLDEYGGAGVMGTAKLASMIEDEWRFLASGIHRNLIGIVYIESKVDHHLRFGWSSGTNGANDPAFQALITRMWQVVAGCSNARFTYHLPLYPFIFDTKLIFHNIREIAHPQLFFAKEGKPVVLRNHFPSLDIVRITRTGAPGREAFKSKQSIDITGVRLFVVQPVVYEEGGLDWSDLKGCPYVSQGTNVRIEFVKEPHFAMHADMNTTRIKQMGRMFSALKPQVVELDLSVKHHRDFANELGCWEPDKFRDPVRTRVGTKNNRKTTAGRISREFPTCKSVRIFMRCYDTTVATCFFYPGGRSHPMDAVLRARASGNFLSFHANVPVGHTGRAGDLDITDNEDTDLISFMDAQIARDDFEDYHQVVMQEMQAAKAAQEKAKQDTQGSAQSAPPAVAESSRPKRKRAGGDEGERADK